MSDYLELSYEKCQSNEEIHNYVLMNDMKQKQLMIIKQVLER